MRREQGSRSRQKQRKRTSEEERQVRLPTVVSCEQEAVWKKRNMLWTQGLRSKALNRHLKLPSFIFRYPQRSVSYQGTCIRTFDDITQAKVTRFQSETSLCLCILQACHGKASMRADSTEEVWDKQTKERKPEVKSSHAEKKKRKLFFLSVLGLSTTGNLLNQP